MKILIKVKDVQNAVEEVVGCAMWLVRAEATAVVCAGHGR